MVVLGDNDDDVVVIVVKLVDAVVVGGIGCFQKFVKINYCNTKQKNEIIET